MKNCRKLSKNYSMHGKFRDISGRYNFWTPIKNNIPDVSPPLPAQGYAPAKGFINIIKYSNSYLEIWKALKS